MATLQKSFIISGDKPEHITEVNLEFLFPVFSYYKTSNTSRFKRKVESTTSVQATHNISNPEYYIELPSDLFMNEDLISMYGYYRYHNIEILNCDNPDSYCFEIGLGVTGENNNLQTMKFHVLLGFKTDVNKTNRNYQNELSDYVKMYGTPEDFNENNLRKDLPEFTDSSFIINYKAYCALLKKVRSVSGTPNKVFLMQLIECLVDLKGEVPEINRNLTTSQKELIKNIMESAGVDKPDKVLNYLKSGFSSLFDFKIQIPEIKPIDIQGKLIVNNIISDITLDKLLHYYKLKVEFVKTNGSIEVINHHWNNASTNSSENTMPFKIDFDSPIIENDILGDISIRVHGFDGTVLWSRKYKPDDDKLNNVVIEVPYYKPEGFKHPDSQIIANKKLRGRVISPGNKTHISTVIIQARTESDELWKIVGSNNTDSSGNFSIDYPYGVFIEAQALVSLAPNKPSSLKIIDNGPVNQTISDDFIYLLVLDDDIECDGSSSDDCGCSDSPAISRLPDHEDLISSDEYSQDVGGSCVNISKPNRTLREYNYHAIVRVSDPDIANYELKKRTEDDKIVYELTGGQHKTDRKPVDLDNPVIWNEFTESRPVTKKGKKKGLPTFGVLFPDLITIGSSSLDKYQDQILYQAVTVATGHILHYKSTFKADGYSLGDLIYSLPLAPGQKKQIVVFDSTHSLTGAETQSVSQDESLVAELISDRMITDQLSGSINESLDGRSSASTEGVSVGLGLSAQYGGMGGSLGVAGGYSNSSSSASQDSLRNVSQHFGEQLRQAVIQNAESYRQLNASVVTTVMEGQEYSVKSEVVANHNHCHTLTMMYFEVMRHYAIYQELSSVEECIFVPLLMTHFTAENIQKWKDILADNLLSMPSGTYLAPFNNRLRIKRPHPLLKAFDANNRILTEYQNVDFPEFSYAEEQILNLKGEIVMQVNIKKPKTRYDRIKSFPIVTTTIEHEEIDKKATIKRNIISIFTFGIGSGVTTRTVREEILEAEKIFDQFMSIDANFATVAPAKCIRVINFSPRSIELPDGTTTLAGEEFFEDGLMDKQQWESYAKILGYDGDDGVYEMLNYYFKGRLISEWDSIFYNDMLPIIFAKIVDSIRIHWGSVSIEREGDTETISHTGDGLPIDTTASRKYTGGERSIKVRINSTNELSKTREELPEYISLSSSNSDLIPLKNHIKLNIGKVNIYYATQHYNGPLFRGFIVDDLLDGTNMHIPLTSREKRNPRDEDKHLVNQLLEHLNSNLEYYNKVLWKNLDPDRRYMLLDGFHLEIYNESGGSIGYRSLASVIKNKLVSVVGNSLVFPVAEGYKVNQSDIIESNGTTESSISLMDIYRPTTPVPPYRISIPTSGVFAEAVLGECDACESIQNNTSQDWDQFRTEEPTGISQVVPPTPVVSEYNPEYKDLAQPIVNIQNAPEAPAPAAGMSQLSELLGKSDSFNNITGLQGNQENAIRTYLSNQENARAFAEMAKDINMQRHNTQNSDSIMESLNDARERGAISDDDYQNLMRQHLQRQIDGGDSERLQAQNEIERARPSLTEAAVDAVRQGQSVRAERTDNDGNTESVNIGRRTGSDQLISINYNIIPIAQQIRNSCWAVAATMMVNWRNEDNLTVEDVLQQAGNNMSPANENYYINIYNEETGLEPDEKSGFIGVLGMTGETSATPSLQQIATIMQNHGPLWVTTDDSEGSGFSPHARILYAIEGSREDPENAILSFANPAEGNSETSTYEEFIDVFEQMSTDNPSETGFIQIVRFTATITATEGSGTARLRAVNIYNNVDPYIGDYEVEFLNAITSRRFSFSGNRYNTMDLSDLDNGSYVMILTPSSSMDVPVNWTSVASGTSETPERIWQKIRVVVEIRDGRLISADSDNIEITGRSVVVKLRALWAKSPNYEERSEDAEINLIVVHHTGGAGRFPNHFLAEDNYSAHYVIPRDGHVTKLVQESNKSFHAGTTCWKEVHSANNYSIGIEIAHVSGSFMNIQYYMLIRLINQLRSAYPGIPASGIVGHCDIGIARTGVIMLGRKATCPGRDFNWPVLEESGIGIIPSDESVVFPTPSDASSVYGGIFSSDQSISLPLPVSSQPSNYNDVINEIKNDIRSIGYYITDNADGLDQPTRGAIHIIKVHFFTGSRRQPDSFYNDRFDFETAKMLKRIVH